MGGGTGACIAAPVLSLSVPREIAIFDQHRFINLLPYEVTSTHPTRRWHDSSSFTSKTFYRQGSYRSDTGACMRCTHACMLVEEPIIR